MNETDDRPTAVADFDPRAFAETADDALIGMVLHDTYKVVRFLAEGGMGRVYEAHHTRLENKRFAIKVLHAELKHSVEVRMRFRREAEAAASIDHPNVVGVHDFGYAADGWPYLVCDYLDGVELGTVIEERGPLPPLVVTSIVRQLCRALEAAHDQGVIHRDIKPANVFLVGAPDQPEVKVLDFGLSRIVELSEAHMTRSGMVMGTPAYMSPEQARGERADHRTDVYGAGTVLYASLTGKPPYQEESSQQAILAVLSREPIRPCEILPSIPVELELIVHRAMARDPVERYATMKELDLALARFEESRARQTRPDPRAVSAPILADSPSPAPDGSEAVGVRRRAVGWLVLAGLLLLVGTLSAALGVFAILAPGRALQPTELFLVSIAVVGSLFTPGVLLVRWLRRRYWSNSARMVTLVAAVRGPVVAAAAVYGIASLLGRMLDVANPHLAGAPSPNASGWLGWAPFLFGLGILAGGGALARHRILGQSPTLARRIIAGPVLYAALAAAGGVVVASGYGMGPEARDQGLIAASADFDEGDGEEAIPGAPAEPTSEPSATEPADRASDPELAAAIAAGLPGLTSLQARYPNDPRVLKPLAMALAGEKGRTSELLRVLDALFLEAPDEAQDPELGILVQKAAVTSATSQRAFELMRDRMGLRGAEMLFDIVLARPELRQRARATLETAEVQRRLSPALKIAYDLHIGVSCAARVELLPQAVRDGDERAIGVLTMLTTKTLRGCGYRQTKPCPPPCGKEAPAMEEAIREIKARLEASAGEGEERQ